MKYPILKEQKQSIQFGSELINFRLLYSQRKHLKISVHPDQEVVVEAPVKKELVDVLNIVKKRAPWIIRQKDYFERFKPVLPPKRYISGETHLYMGRQYRLKVIKSSEETVKLVRGYFNVFVDNPCDSEKVKDLLDIWYAEHAKQIFNRRLVECYASLKNKRIPCPNQLIIRKMQKRWGSCTATRKIVLNVELIKAPVHCIDYVILHELCHLKYPSHNKDFYRLLEIVAPDWKQRKERLELTMF
jgi:predicted metal-dependent hydrolase